MLYPTELSMVARTGIEPATCGSLRRSPAELTCPSWNTACYGRGMRHGRAARTGRAWEPGPLQPSTTMFRSGVMAATPNRLRRRATRRAPRLSRELPVVMANAGNTTPPEVIRGRSWASEIGRPISVRSRSSGRQGVLLAAAGKGRGQHTPGATRGAWGAAVRDVAIDGVHGGMSWWSGQVPERRARYAGLGLPGKRHVLPFVGKIRLHMSFGWKPVRTDNFRLNG